MTASDDDPRVGPHRWVDQQDELEQVIDALVAEPAYAIDTEFHRERTYYPALALVQLAWGDELVLVDPLAVDVSVLTRLFESNSMTPRSPSIPCAALTEEKPMRLLQSRAPHASARQPA